MSSPPPSGAGFAPVGRILWMLLGPALLLLCAARSATASDGWLARSDLAYFVILAGMVAGRALEYLGGDPRTAAGEPSGRAHFVRYIAGLAVAGAAIWVLANLSGNGH